MENKWQWLEDIIEYIKCIFIPKYSIKVMEAKEINNPKGWVQNYIIIKNNKKIFDFFIQHSQPDDGNDYKNVGGIIACGISKIKRSK
jgi:hypothetical protein